MTAQLPGAAIPRPWIDHYPPDIHWDIDVDTTPVHEQVLAVCARTPDAPALDFLGAVTSFGALGRAINAFAAALRKAGVHTTLRLVPGRAHSIAQLDATTRTAVAAFLHRYLG